MVSTHSVEVPPSVPKHKKAMVFFTEEVGVSDKFYLGTSYILNVLKQKHT